MIGQLMSSLRNRLESVLQASHARSESWVVLANPATRDGSPAAGIDNSISMSVLSVRPVRDLAGYSAPRVATGISPVSAPPLFLDLYVLFAAVFSDGNYPFGLDAISRLLVWFNENPVLTDDPFVLPEGVARLVFEIVDLDMAQAKEVAFLAGLKSPPFLLYRVRGLAFEGRSIAASGGAAAPRGRTGGPEGMA